MVIFARRGGIFCPLHKFDLNFTKSTMKNANKVSRSFQHMILLCGCLLIYYSVSARQHKPQNRVTSHKKRRA